MEKKHKEILRSNRTKLMENISSVDSVIDKLYERELVSKEEKDKIKAEKIQNEKIREILDILPTKGAKAFEIFYKCLMETEQNEAARILGETLPQHDGAGIDEPAAKTSKVEDDYQQLKNNLRKDLITLYRNNYSILHLPGLFNNDDMPLLGFYVMPDVNKVEVERALGPSREYKSKLTTLRDVFYKENKSCQNIYLVADAGLGKTAFSKRLVLTWCQAHGRIEKDTNYFQQPEIDALSEFEFVFLLYLRDCFDECDIDKMIKTQICPKLANTPENVEIVLSKEKCLVILDGLDEWKHPETQKDKDIPHRKARNECTILTTTRPWRLSETDLDSTQNDQKLELFGLNKESRNRLKRNVISRNMPGETDEEVTEKLRAFDSEVAGKGISDMETTPLLLLYLLCLWCDEIDLGRSKCEIYCQIVELLLKRRLKDHPLYSKGDSFKREIPSCFAASEYEFCQKHFTFLTSLGKLAFQTLFSETQENRLVFDTSIAKKCLQKEEEETYLDLGLHTGLITQTKQSRVRSQTSKTSFSHKTVQEFFAALYISTCSDQKKDEVQTKALKFCKSIQDILEMSKVFIFISGINAELLSTLSHKLMEVINNDEKTSEYRSSSSGVNFWGHPLREIQDMFVSCVTEIPDSKHVCLQDFFFDRKCNNSYTSLQRLAVNNKTNIKSINIYGSVGQSLSEMMASCELSDLNNCQKIACACIKCEGEEIIHLLSTSVKYLFINGIKIDDERKDARSCLTDEQCKTFQNSSQLKTIQIQDSRMSHMFLNYIINVKSKQRMYLDFLKCSEHVDSPCPGINFDLSQHPELRQLTWRGQYGYFTLCDMNEDKSLLLHYMRNIEEVRLSRVTMSSVLLRRLVEIIERLKHSVRVEMRWCTITPKEEFVHIREVICSSESFDVEKDAYGEFMFVTKK